MKTGFCCENCGKRISRKDYMRLADNVAYQTPDTNETTHSIAHILCAHNTLAKKVYVVSSAGKLALIKTVWS
jgi:hypothetical protein